jgi:hypothetical protein
LHKKASMLRCSIKRDPVGGSAAVAVQDRQSVSERSLIRRLSISGSPRIPLVKPLASFHA